jgi:Sulfotransferase domain
VADPAWVHEPCKDEGRRSNRQQPQPNSAVSCVVANERDNTFLPLSASNITYSQVDTGTSRGKNDVAAGFSRPSSTAVGVARRLGWLDPESCRMTEVKVLYLAGTARSGSTLFDRMMGRLPGVVAVGELGYIWERGILRNQECGCSQPFDLCPFWRSVGDVAFGGWDRVDAARMVDLQRRVQRERYLVLLGEPRLSGTFRAHLDEYSEVMSQLYRGIADSSGSRIIVDSMKELPYVWASAHVPGIDARMVHLVRDSRGVAYSWTKRVERGVSVGPRYLFSRHPAVSALRWLWVNSMLEVLRYRSMPTFLLRYEDLIADPRSSVVRTASFSGLPLHEDDLSFLAGDRVALEVDHTVEGGRGRFRTGAMTLELDEAWRERFDTKYRLLVTSMTSPLLYRYGYLPAAK